MLTMWTSATKKAVKLAAIDTMIQYAILGSTDYALSVSFLKDLVDRLVINGYPRHALREMWTKTVKGTLRHIPCKEQLYTGSTQSPDHPPKQPPDQHPKHLESATRIYE